ncbi:hypothetical protein BGZ93_004308 [Podila epicladia]|nr:hypothetical protein BGZ93_004308 [Podila epicladia]
MSSRDHHHNSSSSSRKRDRSPDGRHSSRRSDRDRDRDRDHDKDRHSSSSSKRRESSPSRKSSRHQSDDERGDKRESSSRSSRHSGKDKDRHRQDRESKKSSRIEDGRDKEKERDKDRSRHSSSSSKRRRDRSESGSGSESSSDGSDSGSGSESEEDELVKKAKSMIQKISEDDYFNKSTEFRLWLRRAKKKYFEDMTADETRRYFAKFVKAWNNFDLDESYYKGIRSSQISNKGSTKYKWGFAKKIGKEDQNQVDSVRDSIDTMTNIRFANEVSRQTGVSTASSLGGGDAIGPPKRPVGPSMPPQGPGPRWPRTADEVADQEDRDQRRRLQDRAAQKSYRKSKEADLEELVPKATGREAMLEKRRAQTAYNRRERSPDVELPEHALMGTGGGDDYKSMLAAERRRKEAREERKHGGGSFGPSAGPLGPSARSSGASGGGGGGVNSMLEAKQAAYKDKEAKQLDAFRQLWAQSQAAKGL